LHIFSLQEPLKEPRHGMLKEVQSPVTYLPKDSIPEWRVQEGRFIEGTFQERPFKELFQEGKLPKELAPRHILDRLVERFVKGVRSVEELQIFAAHVKTAPQAAILAALAKAKGVKHLHAHFGGDVTTVAMLASRLSGVSYSFAAHAVDIYDQHVNRALLKEKILWAQFVITCTEYNRRVLAMLVGKKGATKVIRAYNGVDVTLFRPDPSVFRETDQILAVGRLVEKKGFHELVSACRLLRDKGRSFRCLIVGEGTERDRLTRQIIAVGLQDCVILAGARPQEHVLNMMREATVLVVPSVVSARGDQDGLPTVLIEALAVRLPVISTTLSGIPEIIEHRKTGLLVPPGNSISLAAAIEQLLGNGNLRERLAGRGLKKVQESFDIRKNVRALRNRFARLMLPSARSGA
jgi:glycosyltransferase involved in cell wall biosynthesis